jgi:hypothetical protein
MTKEHFKAITPEALVELAVILTEKDRINTEMLKELSERACTNCEHLKSGNMCYKLEDEIYPDYKVLDNSGFYIEGYDIEKPSEFNCKKWSRK